MKKRKGICCDDPVCKANKKIMKDRDVQWKEKIIFAKNMIDDLQKQVRSMKELAKASENREKDLTAQLDQAKHELFGVEGM